MHAIERPWPGMMMKDNDRVVEWEKGLPTNDELAPLSQTLISPVLACAFSIRHDPPKMPADVQRSSRATILNLRAHTPTPSVPAIDSYPSFQAREEGGGFGFGGQGRVGGGAAAKGGVGSNGGSGGPGAGGNNHAPAYHPQSQAGQHGGPGAYRDGTSYNAVDARSEQGSLPLMMNMNLPYGSYERRAESSYGGRGDESSKGGGSSKNARKMTDSESEDGASAGGPENSSDEPNARTLKRPRLVWTPQLHKRFVDAVGHLGIKNAVPKTIMQLMNVEGLTRENVASHLQKYRLYLKRMQGLSNEGPSASDQLFASTPLPPNIVAGSHYMPSHRDDIGPPPFSGPSVQMPLTGLGPLPMAHAHYGGYEHHPYAPIGRGLPQRAPHGDHRDHMVDNHSYSHSHMHSQPGSPPRQILTLFPTSSH